jgi:hypothetical protein
LAISSDKTTMRLDNYFLCHSPLYKGGYRGIIIGV